MKSLHFFMSIHIPVPRKDIYRRLGYRRGITQVNDDLKRKIEDAIEYAVTRIQLKGAGMRIPIQEMGQSKIILSKSIVFESKDLAKMLRDCEEILLMGATAGNDIIDAIREDTDANDLTRGVVLDAVASEMVDASLDWIINYFNHELRRENKQIIKRRFSAGYGDFMLENQNSIYNILDLGHIGIRINESCIFMPEKSVTAVGGIQSVV
jgi:hypothetical protein